MLQPVCHFLSSDIFSYQSPINGLLDWVQSTPCYSCLLLWCFVNAGISCLWSLSFTGRRVWSQGHVSSHVLDWLQMWGQTYLALPCCEVSWDFALTSICLPPGRIRNLSPIHLSYCSFGIVFCFVLFCFNFGKKKAMHIFLNLSLQKKKCLDCLRFNKS